MYTKLFIEPSIITCALVFFNGCVSSFHIHRASLTHTRQQQLDGSFTFLFADKKTSWSSRRVPKPKQTSDLTPKSRKFLQYVERKSKQYASSTQKQIEVLNQEIDLLLQNKDLTELIVPRDASSLIRLLGRNRIYDAMLKFCRRYCRDIAKASDKATKHTKSDAILYCYTAAIAAIGACSKPITNESTKSIGNYRNKSFLLSLLAEMEHNYMEDGETIKPNSYTLSSVLLGIDDGTQALEILQQFEEKYRREDCHHDILTVQVYNVAIRACGKTYRARKKDQMNPVEEWQLGLSLYNRMKRQGPSPNEQSYIAVLEVLAEAGQLRVAMSIFDEVKQISTDEVKSKLYKPLLKACATTENANLAERFIQQLKYDELNITTEHMNLMLLTLAKCKMHTRALEVLQKMVEGQGTDHSMAPPDIISFNTVLSACANAGEYEAARDLLDDMREGLYLIPNQREDIQGSMIEVRPDVISYNTVISCADAASAFDLINEMRLTRRNRDGVVSPNSISYTNAISRCRKASTNSDPQLREYAFDIAFALFELAKESKLDSTSTDVDLNVYLYSSLIWVAESVGNYKAAIQLLRSMECAPNIICYDGVISALSKRGLHREALYIYYEMLQKHRLQATRNIYLKLAFAINNARDQEVFASPRRKAALLEGKPPVIAFGF